MNYSLVRVIQVKINMLQTQIQDTVSYSDKAQLNKVLILANKHLLIVNKDNLYLHPKTFEKNSSCCVTSFSRRCLINWTLPPNN